MSDWRGADWAHCASQYAQTNHKQGFAAKNELLGALLRGKVIIDNSVEILFENTLRRISWKATCGTHRVNAAFMQHLLDWGGGTAHRELQPC
jgi:hypothetical protein